mgnify:CR=1 FL=1
MALACLSLRVSRRLVRHRAGVKKADVRNSSVFRFGDSLTFFLFLVLVFFVPCVELNLSGPQMWRLRSWRRFPVRTWLSLPRLHDPVAVLAVHSVPVVGVKRAGGVSPAAAASSPPEPSATSGRSSHEKPGRRARQQLEGDTAVVDLSALVASFRGAIATMQDELRETKQSFDNKKETVVSADRKIGASRRRQTLIGVPFITQSSCGWLTGSVRNVAASVTCEWLPRDEEGDLWRPFTQNACHAAIWFLEKVLEKLPHAAGTSSVTMRSIDELFLREAFSKATESMDGASLPSTTVVKTLRGTASGVAHLLVYLSLKDAMLRRGTPSTCPAAETGSSSVAEETASPASPSSSALSLAKYFLRPFLYRHMFPASSDTEKPFLVNRLRRWLASTGSVSVPPMLWLALLEPQDACVLLAMSWAAVPSIELSRLAQFVSKQLSTNHFVVNPLVEPWSISMAPPHDSATFHRQLVLARCLFSLASVPASAASDRPDLLADAAARVIGTLRRLPPTPNVDVDAMSFIARTVVLADGCCWSGLHEPGSPIRVVLDKVLLLTAKSLSGDVNKVVRDEEKKLDKPCGEQKTTAAASDSVERYSGFVEALEPRSQRLRAVHQLLGFAELLLSDHDCHGSVLHRSRTVSALVHTVVWLTQRFVDPREHDEQRSTATMEVAPEPLTTALRHRSNRVLELLVGSCCDGDVGYGTVMTLRSTVTTLMALAVYHENRDPRPDRASHLFRDAASLFRSLDERFVMLSFSDARDDERRRIVTRWASDNIGALREPTEPVEPGSLPEETIDLLPWRWLVAARSTLQRDAVAVPFPSDLVPLFENVVSSLSANGQEPPPLGVLRAVCRPLTPMQSTLASCVAFLRGVRILIQSTPSGDGSAASSTASLTWLLDVVATSHFNFDTRCPRLAAAVLLEVVLEQTGTDLATLLGGNGDSSPPGDGAKWMPLATGVDALGCLISLHGMFERAAVEPSDQNDIGRGIPSSHWQRLRGASSVALRRMSVAVSAFPGWPFAVANALTGEKAVPSGDSTRSNQGHGGESWVFRHDHPRHQLLVDLLTQRGGTLQPQDDVGLGRMRAAWLRAVFGRWARTWPNPNTVIASSKQEASTNQRRPLGIDSSVDRDLQVLTNIVLCPADRAHDPSRLALLRWIPVDGVLAALVGLLDRVSWELCHPADGNRTSTVVGLAETCVTRSHVLVNLCLAITFSSTQNDPPASNSITWTSPATERLRQAVRTAVGVINFQQAGDNNGAANNDSLRAATDKLRSLLIVPACALGLPAMVDALCPGSEIQRHLGAGTSPAPPTQGVSSALLTMVAARLSLHDPASRGGALDTVASSPPWRSHARPAGTTPGGASTGDGGAAAWDATSHLHEAARTRLRALLTSDPVLAALQEPLIRMLMHTVATPPPPPTTTNTDVVSSSNTALAGHNDMAADWLKSFMLPHLLLIVELHFWAFLSAATAATVEGWQPTKVTDRFQEMLASWMGFGGSRGDLVPRADGGVAWYIVSLLCHLTAAAVAPLYPHEPAASGLREALTAKVVIQPALRMTLAKLSCVLGMDAVLGSAVDEATGVLPRAASAIVGWFSALTPDESSRIVQGCLSAITSSRGPPHLDDDAVTALDGVGSASLTRRLRRADSYSNTVLEKVVVEVLTRLAARRPDGCTLSATAFFSMLDGLGDDSSSDVRLAVTALVDSVVAPVVQELPTGTTPPPNALAGLESMIKAELFPRFDSLHSSILCRIVHRYVSAVELSVDRGDGSVPPSLDLCFSLIKRVTARLGASNKTPIDVDVNERADLLQSLALLGTAAAQALILAKREAATVALPLESEPSLASPSPLETLADEEDGVVPATASTHATVASAPTPVGHTLAVANEFPLSVSVRQTIDAARRLLYLTVALAAKGAATGAAVERGQASMVWCQRIQAEFTSVVSVLSDVSSVLDLVSLRHAAATFRQASSDSVDPPSLDLQSYHRRRRSNATDRGAATVPCRQSSAVLSRAALPQNIDMGAVLQRQVACLIDVHDGVDPLSRRGSSAGMGDAANHLPIVDRCTLVNMFTFLVDDGWVTDNALGERLFRVFLRGLESAIVQRDREAARQRTIELTLVARLFSERRRFSEQMGDDLARALTSTTTLPPDAVVADASAIIPLSVRVQYVATMARTQRAVTQRAVSQQQQQHGQSFGRDTFTRLMHSCCNDIMSAAGQRSLNSLSAVTPNARAVSALAMAMLSALSANLREQDWSKEPIAFAQWAWRLADPESLPFVRDTTGEPREDTVAASEPRRTTATVLTPLFHTVCSIAILRDTIIGRDVVLARIAAEIRRIQGQQEGEPATAASPPMTPDAAVAVAALLRYFILTGDVAQPQVVSRATQLEAMGDLVLKVVYDGLGGAKPHSCVRVLELQCQYPAVFGSTMMTTALLKRVVWFAEQGLLDTSQLATVLVNMFACESLDGSSPFFSDPASHVVLIALATSALKVASEDDAASPVACAVILGAAARVGILYGAGLGALASRASQLQKASFVTDVSCPAAADSGVSLLTSLPSLILDSASQVGTAAYATRVQRRQSRTVMSLLAFGLEEYESCLPKSTVASLTWVRRQGQ